MFLETVELAHCCLEYPFLFHRWLFPLMVQTLKSEENSKIRQSEDRIPSFQLPVKVANGGRVFFSAMLKDRYPVLYQTTGFLT